MAASLLETLWADGRRLQPREVVAEFDKHLHDELDLMREAANCSQLRRNFEGSDLLVLPEVHWDWCSTSVMVMERMHGTTISKIDFLREKGVDIPRLARAGVEIFFTQVFRDGFFHADMHPGNIFVATEGPRKGQYIALDFGIVGTLSDSRQELPGAELPCLLQARLQARGRGAHRIRLGAEGAPASTSSRRRSARSANPSSTGR